MWARDAMGCEQSACVKGSPPGPVNIEVGDRLQIARLTILAFGCICGAFGWIWSSAYLLCLILGFLGVVPFLLGSRDVQDFTLLQKLGCSLLGSGFAIAVGAGTGWMMSSNLEAGAKERRASLPESASAPRVISNVTVEDLWEIMLNSINATDFADEQTEKGMSESM